MTHKKAQQSTYTFKRYGSFGTFNVEGSLPLYYLMTTINALEIGKLSYAGELRPDPNKIDFEMLMQRDLDEDRVRKELLPYIEGSTGLPAEPDGLSPPVFFPPLIGAVVPAEADTMLPYFEAPVRVENDDTQRHAIKWGNEFELEFFVSDNPDQYSRSLPAFNLADDQPLLDSEPVLLSAVLAERHLKGVKIVIIDGQHRLNAIDQALKRPGGRERLGSLSIPLCIVLSPFSYEDSSKASAAYPAYEVYRKLFVDVNTTMQNVSGHFAVLLRDHDAGGIIARALCDSILTDHGLEGLALVEWNTKSAKESSRVIRPWSVANVKVLDMSLEKSFGIARRNGEFRSIIDADSIDSELAELSEEEDLMLAPIPFRGFSLAQSELLKKRARDVTAPLLENLILGLDGYRVRKEVFLKHLGKIDGRVSETTSEAQAWAQVKDHILNFRFIPDDDASAMKLLRVFSETVKSEIEERSAVIFQYAVFQRGLIEAWARMIRIGLNIGVSPQQATIACVSLWNVLLGEKATVLSPEREYMQGLVFDGTSIEPKDRTRLAVSYLLVGVLAAAEKREAFLRSCDILGECSEKHSKKLEDEAIKALGNYLSLFREVRAKRLRAGEFTVDRRIDVKRRDELRQAKARLDDDYALLKAGRIQRSEVSRDFDEMVDKLAAKDTARAAQELSEKFGYDHELLEIEVPEDMNDDPNDDQ